MKMITSSLAFLIGLLTFPICSEAVNHGPGIPPTIGVILPLTGPFAYIGRSQHEIIDEALVKVNNAGGIKGQKLELVYMDDSGLPQTTIERTDMLMKKKIIAIIGGSTIATSTQLIRATKIPTFVLAPVSVTNQYWAFRLTPDYYSTVHKILSYIQKNNIRNIAFFNDKTEFGTSGYKEVASRITKYNININYHQEYASLTHDVAAQLFKGMPKDTGAIVNWAIDPSQSIIVEEWKNLGLTKIHLYNSPAFGGMAIVDYLGNKAEGVWAPILRMTKGRLSIFQASALDTFNLIVDILGESYPDFTWVKIRNLVEGKKNFRGSIGVFSFSQKEHFGLTEDPFEMAVYENNMWSFQK